MPESSNRYVRFQAPTGDLRIDYNAEIELTPRLDDPSSVSEVPTPELPVRDPAASLSQPLLPGRSF